MYYSTGLIQLGDPLQCKRLFCSMIKKKKKKSHQCFPDTFHCHWNSEITFLFLNKIFEKLAIRDRIVFFFFFGEDSLFIAKLIVDKLIMISFLSQQNC